MRSRGASKVSACVRDALAGAAQQQAQQDGQGDESAHGDRNQPSDARLRPAANPRASCTRPRRTTSSRHAAAAGTRASRCSSSTRCARSSTRAGLAPATLRAPRRSARATRTSRISLRARRRCEVVLRRPPRGPLAPSTHDVLREARLLRALDGTRRARAARAGRLRRRRGHRRAVLPHGARRTARS